MENNKICTILGAGFIGRYIIKHLDRKGYRSIVISRNPFRKNYILTQARTGYVNIVKFNYTEIKKAIQKSDYVLNLIGILGPSKDFFKIHSELPDYISKLCAESKNVQRLIHVSSIGASKNSKSIYQQSKFSGEEKILNNFSSSIIIRPSLVLGTEDQFTNLWGKLSIFPILPVFNYRFQFQPIWVDCLARAIVNAIDKGNEGKIYEIGGEIQISFGNLVKDILKIIGKKRIVLDVPLSIGKILGSIFQLMPGRPLLTKDQCLILEGKHNIVSDNHLTIKDLGITPANVEKKMSEWLVQYKEGGQFSKV
tara:strand:+ start:775 stop:1701 length:927 start_codon:yes stop_codon:yes gene_type:complete